MKFQEAKAALKEMAKGEYHSIVFELSEYSKDCQAVKGGFTAKCKTYINSFGWSGECASWEMALTDMAEIIKRQGDLNAATEQAPEN